MELLNIGVLAALFVCLARRCDSGDTCAVLQGSPLESCSAAGYNYSFPLPTHLSQRSRAWIRTMVAYMTRRMRNCSVVGVSETIACAVLAPNCREGDPKPFLPCRRVCSEFLKRCSSRMPDYFVDIMIGMCSLLPNSTANTKKCYEPPGFDRFHNPTQLGPLERGCQKLIFPFCQNLGYTHTLITEQRQKKLYRFLYGKNYSEYSNHRPAPMSRLFMMEAVMANFTKCAAKLKKVYCSEWFPPCFVGNELSFYTTCRDVCTSILDDCPGIGKAGQGFIFYCERLASGNATKDNSYCRHTTWPPPLDWANFKEPRPYSPPTSRHNSPTTVIVISIIVPVIAVGLVLLAVFLYKSRRRAALGYSRQQDDRIDLTT